jgi:hypothetical protein
VWAKKDSFWMEFDRVTQRVERRSVCSEEEEVASQATLQVIRGQGIGQAKVENDCVNGKRFSDSRIDLM